MKKALAVAAALALVCLAVSAVVAEELVRIPGAGGPITMLRAAAKDFMVANPGVKVEIPDSSGTGGGIKGAGEGTAELGRVARKPNEKEASYNLSYLPFAKCPVVFQAHPGVKLAGITTAQSVGIFNGTITNWKEVGGPDLKIRVIARAEGEANLAVLKQSIPEWKNLVTTSKSKQASSDQEGVQFVLENEGAVGFGPLPEAKAKGLTVLALDGKKPTDAGYPALLEFAFVYKADKMTGAVKKFVDFVLSPAGSAILKANSGIPLK